MKVRIFITWTANLLDVVNEQVTYVDGALCGDNWLIQIDVSKFRRNKKVVTSYRK